VRTRQLSFPLAVQHGQSYVPKTNDLQNGLLQHVLDTQKPLLLSSNVARTAAALGLPPPDKSVQSWLGVPLLAAGKLLGAMVIISDDPRRILKPADQRLLTTIAATASIAIDNAQLYDGQTARAEQLALLNRVMALLTGTLSPDAVLDAVVSSASLISKTTGVAVYLLEGESVKLVRYAGLSDDYAARPPELLLTDFSQGPVIVTDARHDPGAAAQLDLLDRENKAAWLEVPLVVGDTGIGVLVLYYDTTYNFSETGIEIIRAFANQAAQAVKNARQYTTADKALERRAEQMYTLATLGRQLTAPMDPAAICELVLNRSLEPTVANAGFIALNDEPNHHPQVFAQAGYPPAANLSEATFQNTIAGEVLRSGVALSVSEARRAAQPPLLENAQSQLAVPIIRDTRVVGVIVLESTRADAFHDEDLHFLIQLANHTTIAIDNSRLFRRIAEARDRLEVMLNAMTEAIILVDNNSTIALANPRVSLMGLNPNQLLGQNIGSLLADGDLNLAAQMGFESAEHCQAMIRELQTPGSWLSISPTSYSVTIETGTQFIQRHIIPVSGVDGEPVGVLLVFYDQTEERELLHVREELSRMIVHDLRSPLAAVTTGLKLLREVIPANSPYRSVVDSTTETSQRAIRKILSRVDSLLDVSRMESGQLALDTEPTELATLVDSVCIELSPLAHELEVKLNSEVESKLPLLDIDPDKIERVLQNLLDNALKYCPADTAITIRAFQPGSRGAPHGFVRVEVTDQGPGVPDEYKSRLFERFVQMKGQRGSRRGVGLGLTFCKMTVEAHGGTIWIEDNPGGGSIFAFTLPVVGTQKRDKTGEQPAVRQPQS
jgi:signal transduction histidine kinase